MTGHTHGDFMELPHWKIKPPAQNPISHSITLSRHWSNQFLPYPINAEPQDAVTSINFISLWFNSTRSQLPDLRCARPMPHRFSHCAQCIFNRGFLRSNPSSAKECKVRNETGLSLDYWGIMFLGRLRSYTNVNWLVTVCTHGELTAWLVYIIGVLCARNV